MPFSDVIGQDRAVEILQRELSHRRISHAYLFSGAESIGKKHTALAFAMAILCSETETDSCGACTACRRAGQWIHPDVRLFEPEAKTKGATEKLYIEQIRALQQEISLRPMEGGKKIFMIDQADRMVDQAANALLKVLEEPPEDSILVLVTAYPDQLPSTILSRCRKVHFGPLSDGAVEKILVRRKGLSEKQAKLLARHAQGGLDRVLNQDEAEMVSKRDRFLEWMQGWDLREIGSILDVSGRFTGNTREAIEFVEFLISWTRDLISLKLRGSNGSLIHADRITELAEEGQKKNLTELLGNADTLEEALQRLRRNINQRLVLETALVRMAQNG